MLLNNYTGDINNSNCIIADMNTNSKRTAYILISILNIYLLYLIYRNMYYIY